MSRRAPNCWWGLAAAAGVGLLVLPGAGRWLVARDDFARADVAVVLSGQPITRALAARDLYRQGRADLLMVIPEPAADPALEAELDALRLSDPDPRSWPERIFAASGVPRDRVMVLPHPADGTINEALAVRAALRGRDQVSVAIVTSPFASRRARFIFRRVVGRGGRRIWSFPTPYERFAAEGWWRHPRTALTVANEYQKFVVNAVRLVVGW